MNHSTNQENIYENSYLNTIFSINNEQLNKHIKEVKVKKRKNICIFLISTKGVKSCIEAIKKLQNTKYLLLYS